MESLAHTKFCFLDVLSTRLQKALTAGNADFWVSFPSASSAVAPKEAFLCICAGMFAKGLILAPWFVPAVPRIPRGSHSQTFPAWGLLSPPQAMFCWHSVKPANPTTLMFLGFFQCSAHSPTRSAFAAFSKESKQFLPKYSNLGN